MSDHLVLFVDRLARPVPVDPVAQPAQLPSEPSPSPATADAASAAGPSASSQPADRDGEGCDEEEPLIQMAECRICQEEDSASNLETPCACSGSLKYAHRKCVQHWCNEKGDIICEICHQDGIWDACYPATILECCFFSPNEDAYVPLINLGILPPPPRPHPEETTIDIGGGWTISGTPLDLRDPRLLAIAEAERQFLDAEYDEYAASNASGAAFCRSAALILMALLLLRHALSVTDGDASDDDPSNFSLFSCFELLDFFYLAILWLGQSVFCNAGDKDKKICPSIFCEFLTVLYYGQEAAALAATQVAFVLQSGQRRGLQFAIAPAPGPTVHQEQV
ncbi:Zinc finger, RING-CH-type [Sesbania bispinosa]|nr:Zinc finger, RING-CH-type [Sesbania bispinosa]